MKNINDKLLILGSDSTTAYVLEYAKKLGVHTIITDYNTIDKNPLKKLSDEAWFIDLSDLDSLEKKCKEENITAVFSGNHEYCLEQTRLLAKRLNLPFYATDKAWESTLNKDLFKKACIEVGLDVPQRYSVSNDTFEEDLQKLNKFPLIIKPSDGSASRGISICNNTAELIEGYKKALSFSTNKNIIVEDFIDGDEYNMGYHCNNGTFYPLYLTKAHSLKINKDKKFVLLYNQCPEYSDYINNVNPKIIELAKHLGCTNNMFFLQFIKKGDTWYTIEMNYRLPGLVVERAEKELFNTSFIENALLFALGKTYNFSNPDPKAYGNRVIAGYMIYSRPGIIDKIEGLDKIKALEGVDICVERFKENDEVAETNNMTQIAYFMSVWGTSREAVKNKIKTINETLSFKDSNGNELLAKFENYEIF